MTDHVVTLKLPGKILKGILENAISNWPQFDGRWPMTSGLKFEFDPRRPAGDRIVEGTLKKDSGELIEMETEYTMASLYFLTEGKDGFQMFLDEQVIKVTDRDDSPTIQDILKNFFITFQKTDEEIA